MGLEKDERVEISLTGESATWEIGGKLVEIVGEVIRGGEDSKS